MSANGQPGRIITFYSYKGGTGRTMLLANVAWILASRGRRVLVVDWDLEAPGLHRYLHPFLLDKELISTEGVIDLVTEYVLEAMSPPKADAETEWFTSLSDVSRYALSLDYKFDLGGSLDLLPAGRQGSAYASRVNAFGWQDFYGRMGGGAFIDEMKSSMRSEYDYVLVDSRTGVSDTSGICTVQLPDILVVCFTLNTQSIEGAAAVAESVRAQRDVAIFPIPTRVEFAEKQKLDYAREYARQRFAPFIGHMERGERESYWGGVEVIYQPFYAYEEILASFADTPGQPTSLLASVERITSRLTDGQVAYLEPPAPEERLKVLREYIRNPDENIEEERIADLRAQLAELERRREALTAEVERARTQPRRVGAAPAPIQGELEGLAGALDGAVPAKSLDRNLLLATWNLRAFGDLAETWRAGRRDKVKRDLRALAIIAEIVSRFDVVAIQEAKGNLRALRHLVRSLGDSWSFITTDVVRGAAGNDERLAFVFDMRRVRPAGLASELAFPDYELGMGTESAFRFLARPPYALSFQTGDDTFILVALHLLWGSVSSDRLPELRSFARWMSDWATEIASGGQSLIMLGDFNIDRLGDDAFNVFTETGLHPPPELNEVPRSIFAGKPGGFYDQMAWFDSPTGTPLLTLRYTGRAGGFDFVPFVFLELDRQQLSWRVSDHLPLWCEFRVAGPNLSP